LSHNIIAEKYIFYKSLLEFPYVFCCAWQNANIPAPYSSLLYPNSSLTFLKAVSQILPPKTNIIAIVSIATRATYLPRLLAGWLAVCGLLHLLTSLLQAFQAILALSFCVSSRILFAASLTFKLKFSGSSNSFLKGVHFALGTASSGGCAMTRRNYLTRICRTEVLRL
jgi:hypothetical protein